MEGEVGIKNAPGVTWGVRLPTSWSGLLQQSHCLRLGEGACREPVEVDPAGEPRNIPRHTVRAIY